MRPAQFIGRMRKDKILARVPAEQDFKRLTEGGLPLYIEVLDGDPGYLSRFRPEELFADTVTLMGSEGNETVTAEDLAGWAGTISYEILLSVGSRVEKEFVSESQDKGAMDP